MFNFMRVLLAGLLLLSSGAFAEHYYWTSEALPKGQRFNSPMEACQASVQYRNLNGNDFAQPYTLTVQNGNPSKLMCSAYFRPWKYYGYGISSIYRHGDSCPVNTEYNEQTGECLAPEPEPESFEFLFCYNYDGGDGCAAGTNKGRPDSFCKNGVVFSADYNPSTTDASCYSYGNGDGTSGPAIMCSVTGTPTDQSCNNDYKTDTPDNSCPAGTVGGEVNNKRVCIPSGTGGGDGDGGEDGDNSGNGAGSGDGSGGQTGGDGDGNGSDGGGDGTGSGGSSGGGNNGGDGSGGGDGNGTDGDGSGNGSGNGSGDGEGEGEEEGIGSGQGVEFCESGRCEFGDEKGDFFGGEVRTFSESMSAIFEGMQNSPLNSAISNIRFPEGGTCPTGSMSIDIGIGVIPLTFEEHCNFWEQISPVLSAAFLALWSVIAVRVFLSA